MQFLNYENSYFGRCLQIFNENCPQYFAENEREDYIDFLKGNPSDYFIGVSGNFVASAFGVVCTPEISRVRLSWILVLPKLKGRGVGTKMMFFSKATALNKGASVIDIAASHLSAPFFEKFGAEEINTIENGWGLGMHRVNMEIKL
jgi:GNAT superfamily N-acetyltransferase